MLLNRKSDILSNNQINEHYVIEVNQETTNIDENAKRRCKILKVSAGAGNLFAIFAKISNFNEETFQNLFIFILEVKNAEVHQEIENFLLTFTKNRPLFLQITYERDNLTKFLFKDEDSDSFCLISDQFVESESLSDFQSFFRYFIGENFSNFEELTINAVPNVYHLSLILKFINTLRISKTFQKKLIFKCAAKATKHTFFAALDLSFQSQGKILNIDAQKLLFTVWKDKNLTEEAPLKSDKSSSRESDSESDDDETKEDKNTSILLNAVTHSNKDVADFLISNCTHLIQQLPLNHQFKITQYLFDSKQLDFLTDLIALSDFPFPKKFKPKRVTHQRFKELIDERENFHNSIEDRNMEKISEFIYNNMGLSIAFNVEHESALCRSLESDKYEVFFHLMSFGYRAIEFKNYEKFVSARRLTKMKAYADEQTRINANNALENENKSVQILSARSFIHNRKVSKQDEAEFRNKIKRWFRQIYNSKHGSKLLNAASQCEKLRMIFDFECETVGNSDLKAQGSLGTTYTELKWIFIGAKTSDHQNREQIIKGVIAHELCHFVLLMVYQYKENPYYSGDVKASESFNDIVEQYEDYIIDECYDEEKMIYNDGCNGIISTVYIRYEREDFHAELIVRAPQIFAEFDNNNQKVEYLENKYELLFDYYINIVLLEFEKFNLHNQELIQNLNKQAEVLKKVCSLNYEFSEFRNFEYLEKKFVVIKTNIPLLLLLNLYNFLYSNSKSLLDANNVFITSENLQNDLILRNLKEGLDKNTSISVFIYVTSTVEGDFMKLFKNRESKVIFIVSNDIRYKEVMSIVNKDVTIEEVTENYSWMDLSSKTQCSMLKTLINFQNHSFISFLNIFSNENAQDSEDSDMSEIIKDTRSIFDEKMLNLLVEKSDIVINKNLKNFEEEHFDFLFKPRNLLKCFKLNYQGNYSLIPFTTTLLKSQLLRDLEKERYVLLSDIAGTGKSWMLKNLVDVFLKIYPKKWISFIDLKQFIKAFKMYKDNSKFEEFIVEKILKIEIEYEANFFRHLYKNGQIILLFDGFDEIAPDYAEIVLKLVKSLDFNDGNQIWIATRDYFEINLKEKLNLNAVFKLQQFTLQESIDTIALSWVINDYEDDSNKNKKIDSKEAIENTENFKSYQELAKKMISKILIAGKPSIGYPQFYKMVATVFKDKKDAISLLTLLAVYAEFIKIQYTKWADEKGELRKNASVDANVTKSLNYRGIHQYYALKSLFPENDSLPGSKDWDDVEIIACSFLINTGDDFIFSHETYREYFAVDYITMIALKGGSQVDDQFCSILLKFLTVPKFGIVRIFLNDALGDKLVFEAFENCFKKFATFTTQNINDFINISEIFEQNLENLSILLIKFFGHFEYDKIKQIFRNNMKNVQSIIKHPKLFVELQNFMFNKLNSIYLKRFMKNFNLILEVAYSHLDAKDIDEFLTELSSKMHKNDLNEILKIVDYNKKNIFTCLTQTNHEFSKRFTVFFKFMDKFLSKNEMMELLKHFDSYGMNIFHIVMEMADVEKLELVWTEIENFFNNQDASNKFRDLFKQQTIDHGSTVTVVAANDPKDNIPFYESFWKLLSNTFRDREELKNLLCITNNYSISFIHWILACNQAKAIEFTIIKLEENLGKSQYQEIMRLKATNGRNLIQNAFGLSKELNVHKVLWKHFKSSFELNEFVEILGEQDADGDNAFNLAAAHSSSEVLDLVDKELESSFSINVIKTLLKNLGNERQTLFHSAACYNKSLKAHQMLWKILKKYFNNSELLNFIKHFTLYGNNMIEDVIEKNSLDVLELTWQEVQNVLVNNKCSSERIKKCEKAIENLLRSIRPDSDDLEHLKLNWITNEHNNFFVDTVQLILEDKIPVIALKDLILFKSNENIANHEILWIQLVRNFPNQEDLKNLLIKKKNDKHNYIHLLVKYNNSDVIEFTLNKIKENLNESQYEEILRSKGSKERNLIHRSAISSKEEKTHKIFWNAFQSLSKGPGEFSKILGECDKEGSNVFNLAAAYATADILKFMVFEVIKNVQPDEIKVLLTNLNIYKQNMIQSAVIENRCLVVHETLWHIAQTCYSSSEILEFIKHLDIYGNNVLTSVVKLDNNAIIEKTWKKVKQSLSSIDESYNGNIQLCENIIEKVMKSEAIKDEDRELLKLKWISNDIKVFDGNIDLLFKQKLVVRTMDDLLPFVYDTNLNNHKILWEHVIEMLRTQSIEERHFHPHKNNEGNNILHRLVVHNNADVIEFTFEKMKAFLRERQYKEIIVRRGSNERNLLQIATSFSRDIKIIQVIWNIFYNLGETLDEFFDFLKETDKDGNNVFTLALCHPESDVFKMLIDELKKLASRQEISNIFTSLNNLDQNLLLSATKLCKCVQSHEIIWEVLMNYFKTSEILQFINQCDNRGDNILHNAVIWNTSEIINLTWNKISDFIKDQNDQIKYLEIKGHKNKNLYFLSFENQAKDATSWVENIAQKYNLSFLAEMLSSNSVE